MAITAAQGRECVCIFKALAVGLEGKKQFIVTLDRPQLINEIRGRRKRARGIQNESEVPPLGLWEILMPLSDLGKRGGRKSFRYLQI